MATILDLNLIVMSYDVISFYCDLKGNIFGCNLCHPSFVVIALIFSELRGAPRVPEDQIKPGLNRVKGADGCSERLNKFLSADYQLRPSDGEELTFFTNEDKNFYHKLNDLMKSLKGHYCTLFKSHGRFLKEEDEFIGLFFQCRQHTTLRRGQRVRRLKGNGNP